MTDGDRTAIPPYRAPRWLPGGHAQTLWPLLIKPAPPAYRRERWDTPDGDFIDADFLDAAAGSADGAAKAAEPAPTAPLVILFHGLEGSSRSHYAVSLALACQARGWGFVVPHFRGCSGEANRLPRAYHSGDSAEIGWVLARLAQRFPGRPLHVAGVSLGGNALLKWLGEQEEAAGRLIRCAASICPPLDLAAAGFNLGRGFNLVYTRHFLGTLKASALAKLKHHPGLFDPGKVRQARNLYDFDEVVTAPLHGFQGALDYWTRASAKPLLDRVRLPTLLINPANDPFLPAAALPSRHQVSAAVRLEQPAEGGHVGFVTGSPPGRLDWLPRRLLHFFDEHQS
ncbi:YheT family hydrolase [Oryzomicrobium sp.]|uniref:YheT family hydrolase n=1 Tax=Oryzomicrobium sp. TaxID=1911578 RepID=UPI002FDFFA76